jgi:Trk K+ transport system NAD-binding subunit
MIAGATAIASSVAPLIDQLMVNIEYPAIKGLMRLGKGNIDVFEVRVPDDAFIVGMTVEAIAQTSGFPANCNFVAVEQPGGVLEVARGTTVVHPELTVIVLAMEADLEVILRLLTRSRSGTSRLVTGP